MANWNNYKSKVYSRHESRKMDYELDILHELITEVYEHDDFHDKVKETLDKIAKVVHSK